MKRNSITPLTAVLGASVLASTMAAAAQPSGNPFQLTELTAGYQLAEETKAAEGKCGEGKCGDKKAEHEGKCGDKAAGAEGKCGDKKAADGKEAEGKCGEGKCGDKKPGGAAG